MSNEITAYLGPEGSYSQLAAQTLCKGSALLPKVSFRSVFSALVGGEATCAVIPLENTVNGAVVQNLDLLLENVGLTVVEGCRIKIEHRLATLNGAPLSGIKRVYSHPQALEQCSKYLYENLPQAKLIATSSTSESLKKITSAEAAGIVAPHARAEGVTLSKESISDEKTNYTYFYKVVKGEFVFPNDSFAGKGRLFFSFTCRHRPGQLVAVLSVLAEYGINMTEIESRPIKNRPGEFVFFIEIETGENRKALLSALDRIKEQALSFRIFGAY